MNDLGSHNTSIVNDDVLISHQTLAFNNALWASSKVWAIVCSYTRIRNYTMLHTSCFLSKLPSPRDLLRPPLLSLQSCSPYYFFFFLSQQKHVKWISAEIRSMFITLFLASVLFFFNNVHHCFGKELWKFSKFRFFSVPVLETEHFSGLLVSFFFFSVFPNSIEIG